MSDAFASDFETASLVGITEILRGEIGDQSTPDAQKIAELIAKKIIKNDVAEWLCDDISVDQPFVDTLKHHIELLQSPEIVSKDNVFYPLAKMYVNAKMTEKCLIKGFKQKPLNISDLAFFVSCSLYLPMLLGTTTGLEILYTSPTGPCAQTLTHHVSFLFFRGVKVGMTLEEPKSLPSYLPRLSNSNQFVFEKKHIKIINDLATQLSVNIITEIYKNSRLITQLMNFEINSTDSASQATVRSFTQNPQIAFSIIEEPKVNTVYVNDPELLLLSLQNRPILLDATEGALALSEFEGANKKSNVPLYILGAAGIGALIYFIRKSRK